VAFGWRDSDLVGRSLRDLVHAQDRSVLAESMAQAVQPPQRGLPPARELRVLTGSGSFVWTEVRWSDLLHDPGVRGLVCTLRDVDERHQTLDRLTDLALRDTLTGLPNRAVLVERIGHAIARRDSRGALLFVDLDDFKAVNDALGHLTGDLLLQVVAHRLLTAVRPEDTCGRLSGDEFVVLAESVTTRAAALQLADRLEHAVGHPAEVRGARLVPRVSIGVTMLADAGTVDQALQAADRDMYRSKTRHHAERPPMMLLRDDPRSRGGSGH
jgi:diguanylate cyclase (GGDEF)-like protein/PAS domain S-box-containing protein